MTKRPAPARSGLTRKQISRARREARIQRQVLIGAGVVAVAIIVLIAGGMISEAIVKPQRIVAIVDGEEITVAEFQEYAEVYYFLYYYIQLGLPIEQLALYGITPETISLASLDNMIEDVLVREKAADMGIEVTDTEAEEYLQLLLFGYDAGEPEPTSTPTATPEEERTPTTTPTFVYTLTPSPTPTLEPGVTPTLTSTPTEIPSEPPTITPTPTPFPTREPLTEDGFNQSYTEFVDTAARTTGLAKDRFESLLLEWARTQLIRDKLTDALDLPADETKTLVHAAHILVETEEEAQSILDRLEQGEEFEVLAAELSTDTNNAYKGGDLGWFGRGRMVAEFEEVAFNLPIGEISSPVESQFGFHIIKVYDRTEVPTTPQEQAQQRAEAFDELVFVWRTAADLTIEDISSYIPKFP